MYNSGQDKKPAGMTVGILTSADRIAKVGTIVVAVECFEPCECDSATLVGDRTSALLNPGCGNRRGLGSSTREPRLPFSLNGQAAVTAFRSAQLVSGRPSAAAQPARQRHRLEDRVSEHVVACSQVLSVRPLLIVQELLPRRLSRLGRLLLWRRGRRALLASSHVSCPPGRLPSRFSFGVARIARRRLLRPPVLHL